MHRRGSDIDIKDPEEDRKQLLCKDVKMIENAAKIEALFRTSYLLYS
jgi:hypothetical protein